MVSSKPSKQRLQMIKAPMHRRRKFFTAMLSDELTSKYGIKRMPIRVGDVVRILRGDWSGHEGKVVRINMRKARIYVDGVTIKRSDGTPMYYGVHPSKVMIVKLDMSDKWREKIVKRCRGIASSSG